MKRFIPSLICLEAGIALGWYLDYTRPALQAMHLYQEIQKTSGLSEEEKVKLVPESMAFMKREDEVTRC